MLLSAYWKREQIGEVLPGNTCFFQLTEKVNKLVKLCPPRLRMLLSAYWKGEQTGEAMSSQATHASFSLLKRWTNWWSYVPPGNTCFFQLTEKVNKLVKSSQVMHASFSLLKRWTNWWSYVLPGNACFFQATEKVNKLVKLCPPR